MKEIDEYFLKNGLNQEDIVCSIYSASYVRAKDIFEAGYEVAQKKEEQKKLIIELGNPINYISKGCIEYLERKYGININRKDLDNFLNREI